MGIINNLDRFLQTQELRRQIQALLQGHGGGGSAGIKLTSQGYDADNKKLINLAAGSANFDALQKQQVDTIANQLRADSLQVDGTSHMTGNLDLRGQNLINPGEVKMNRKLITNLNTDENNDLSAVNMVTLKKYSATAITKDIDLKDQFNVINAKQNLLTFYKANYDTLVPFANIQRDFLSRVEEFPMQTQLNMNGNSITNLKNPRLGGEAATKTYADDKLAKTGGTMSGAINMGSSKITNLGDPTANADASTKKYVDDTDKKLRDQISQEVILIQNALDGKVDVGNIIDMKGERITNLGNPLSSTDAISANFVQNLLANYLNTGGGTMTGQIDMGNNKIIGLTFPTAKTDAATKEYVDRAFISPSGSMKNVFQYIMDDVNETSSEFGITVLGILDFPQSPHLLNKKAIKFQMGLQSNDSTRYYSRLGLNFFSLPEGDYTLVVEFFHPTNSNIELNCLSTTINVNHQIAGPAGRAWKNIVQLSKNVTTPPEYLMVDMKCAVDQDSSNNVGWLIVWGVSGFHTTLPSSVFDQPFVFETGKMVMETDLDLNGKRLLNYPKSKAVILGLYTKATESESEKFTINNETAYHVFGFDFTVKKITLHFTVRDGPIIPGNSSVMIKASSKTQSASGVFIGNNAISYSFDFAVAAIDEFELSLKNRGGIARANATILVEI